MIFMLSTAVISLLRTVLPRSADSFADRIQCWLQSQQMCCSFAFFHVVSTPKLLFIYVIASPMMIPIFDIPEHHDVKHWVLKHVPSLLFFLSCTPPHLTHTFRSSSVRVQGCEMNKVFHFTVACQSPRSRAWNLSKIRGAPAILKCVSVSAANVHIERYAVVNDKGASVSIRLSS